MMSIHDEIPASVAAAAIEVGEWMENHGYQAWRLGPCADRKAADAMEQRIAELESELAAIKGQEPVAWCVCYNDTNAGEIPSNPTMYKPEAEAIVRNNPTELYLLKLYALPVADKDAERYRFFVAALSQNEAWAFDLVDLAHKADFDGTIDAEMTKGE